MNARSGARAAVKFLKSVGSFLVEGMTTGPTRGSSLDAPASGEQANGNAIAIPPRAYRRPRAIDPCFAFRLLRNLLYAVCVAALVKVLSPSAWFHPVKPEPKSPSVDLSAKPGKKAAGQ